MDKETIIFLLLLTFISLQPLVASQMLVSRSGIEGEWRLLHESIGVSAMHMQLLRNNKVVIFDRTDFGRSNLSLPGGRCRYDSHDLVIREDCSAHSVLYDVGSNTFRPLMVQTDTWCSSGAVLPDGTLVQTGGYNDGDHIIRTLAPCTGENCDWVEFPRTLIQRRWYSTDHILPDARIIVIGGRNQHNYEFYPKNPSSFSAFWLQFLSDTRDGDNENNLYAFVFLLPDGNLFIFANTRAIILDYKKNEVVRELPSIPGNEPRNYPSTGSAVLLPLDENSPMQAEIMVCGGAPRRAFGLTDYGVYMTALSSCGRITISDDHVNDGSWKMEQMPTPRVMSDMLILPNGDIILINGAARGTAGWENARNPVTRPVIYRPNRAENNRFSVMEASLKPRLYHSTAILLTDGRVLVGGSNPHKFYNFTGVEFPTDLSLEAFSPPYLAPEYAPLKPTVLSIDEILIYKQPFSVTFTVPKFLKMGIVSVRIVAPSFTTHSFSMNQRMVVLKSIAISTVSDNTYRFTAFGPSTKEIAPPGYYMLFVVHAGIPSSGVWVQIQDLSVY
ncbi:aldehyde oxidase GLOX-like [Nicotiana tabacum]|uniref:Aldehyde oxidase GLOX-like n=1 Tax=Nicotiana tabacum TaxID=4097 RepID=A0A1S4B2A0_TOBAC|nr:PREDICTED: WSC domain-containing protein ARB_07867-like [Nicotiana tabacum]